MPTIDLGLVVGPQGPQGNTGSRGPQGAQGNPGPNQVTGSTSTTLSGILQGNGSVVQAVASDNAPVSGSTNIVRSGKLYTEFAKHARPNLLDNWYFVGGGGNGSFPVAQKAWNGASSYAGTGYFVDRWYSYAADQVVTLMADGVRIYNAESTAHFQQYLEPFTVQAPTTFTFSVLYRANGDVRLAENLTGTTRYSSWQNPAGGVGLLTLRTTVPAGGPVTNPHVWITTRAGVTATIFAAKLEVGDTSTLAYQDADGYWNLADVPSYSDQLMRCQRHMFILNPEELTNVSFGVGSAYSSSAIYPFVPIPVPLRAVPTVTYSGTPAVQVGSTRTSISSIAHYRRLPNVEQLNVSVTGLTAGQFYILGYGSPSGRIILDANIYPA